MKRANTRRNKGCWQQWIAIAVFLVMGGACGAVMAETIIRVGGQSLAFGDYLIRLALLLIGFYLMLCLQIILHEAGHLVFGLMTGYRFCSFRVGSLMLIRDGERFHFRRMALAGTGGQCLMAPPEFCGGKLPYILYNLGGSIVNAVVGGAALALYFALGEMGYLSALLFAAAIIGFAYALLNGLPLRLGTVDNDGYNALSLGKSPEALRSFWIQMKVSELTSQGVRLRMMPEAWFVMPPAEELRNSMTAVLAVFRANRLMDEHRFAEADRCIAEILEQPTAVNGLHRALLVCDSAYCALIGASERERKGELQEKQQKKIMRQMRNYPSVIRTEYACELLAERDEKKAEELRQHFEKTARVYPYACEIQAERELMELARACAQGEKIVYEHAGEL